MLHNREENMNEDDDDDIFYDAPEFAPPKEVHDEDVDAFHEQIDAELLERIGNLSLDHNSSELEAIRSLLEAGANPNLIFEGDDAKLGSHNSLLHKAALCEKPDLAEMLLKYGANPKVRNSLGKAPITLIKDSNIKVMNIFKAAFIPKPLDISTPPSPTDITRSLSPDDQSLLTDLVAEFKLLRSEVAALKNQPRSQGDSIEVVEEEISAPPSPTSTTSSTTKVEINNFDDLKEHFSPKAMRSLIVKLANNKDAQSDTEEQIRNALTTYLPTIVKKYKEAKKAADIFAQEKKSNLTTQRHTDLSTKATNLQSDIVTIFDYANKAGYPAIQQILEAEKAKLPTEIMAVLERSISPPTEKALEAQRKAALRSAKPINLGGMMSELNSNLLKMRGKNGGPTH
jgi:hypothetical protein